MRYIVEVRMGEFAVVDTANNNYVSRTFYVKASAEAYAKKLNEDDANAGRNDESGQPS